MIDQTGGAVTVLRELKHYAWTLLLWASGLLVDHTPRDWLPGRFVAWYNHGLDTWTWDA